AAPAARPRAAAARPPGPPRARGPPRGGPAGGRRARPGRMGSRATARLFVAVDVPPAVREELAAWARDVASALGFKEARAASAPLRVLEPEAQHLTLCFLGSRPVEEIDTIGAAIGACAGYVDEVSVGAPLWLPPRRPRALAVEVHDRGGGLASLQHAVSSETSRAIAWEPERRRFRAHITLARLPDA